MPSLGPDTFGFAARFASQEATSYEPKTGALGVKGFKTLIHA
jgi:hypothetical protein